MKRLTTTPFGQRPVSAGLREAAERANQPPALPHVNKYEILRLLSLARRDFGVSDRDLSVLAALASFSKGAELRMDMNLIVFPSNKTLAERVHGMPESTLRRHLAALVKAGLVLRHDSPNGKRFAARGRAFGFDLTPLLVRAREFALAAEQVRIAEARVHAMREEAVLALRDAGKLVVYGVGSGVVANWDELGDQVKLTKRALRRKLDGTQMGEALEAALELLKRIDGLIGPIETGDLSGNDNQNERHQYNNTKEDTDLKSQEKLRNVLSACPEIQNYAQGIRHWHELVAAAAFVRAMMGIGSEVWNEAVQRLGASRAAVVVAVILERFSEIENPGGYLQVLVRKAENKAFSVGNMLRYLEKSREKAAA